MFEHGSGTKIEINNKARVLYIPSLYTHGSTGKIQVKTYQLYLTILYNIILYFTLTIMENQSKTANTSLQVRS
jgi:hypothetical protein